MDGPDAHTGEGEGQQTSLRYLRLQNGFRNMLKSGLERIDEQVGALCGVQAGGLFDCGVQLCCIPTLAALPPPLFRLSRRISTTI